MGRIIDQQLGRKLRVESQLVEAIESLGKKRRRQGGVEAEPPAMGDFLNKNNAFL